MTLNLGKRDAAALSPTAHRDNTFRENWYMGWMAWRSFMVKYSREARAAAGL